MIYLLYTYSMNILRLRNYVRSVNSKKIPKKYA